MSAAAPGQDTIPDFPAAEADDEAHQPAVMFHCENGRLGAYLVPSGPEDGDPEGEQMVPIILDSAPSC